MAETTTIPPDMHVGPRPMTRRHVLFTKTMKDITNHAKRSLLDVLDAQDISLKQAMVVVRDIPEAREALNDYREMIGILKRRVHNDVSVLVAQAVATYEILENGGMPPFSRENGQ